MVVSSTLSHTVQGVPEMQCPKGTRWVSATRMERTQPATCTLCTPETSVGRGSTGKGSSANKRRHALDDSSIDMYNNDVGKRFMK
jgi:hypothetical protein